MSEKEVHFVMYNSVADPDLQIREGGGGGGAGASPNNFFSAFGASVWSKNNGGSPPLDPPL